MRPQWILLCIRRALRILLLPKILCVGFHNFQVSRIILYLPCPTRRKQHPDFRSPHSFFAAIDLTTLRSFHNIGAKGVFPLFPSFSSSFFLSFNWIIQQGRGQKCPLFNEIGIFLATFPNFFLFSPEVLPVG